MYSLDQNRARRIEASEAEDIWSMRSAMAALPGNPYGLAVRRFGPVVALACPSMPGEGFINRVVGGGAASLAQLEEAIAWVRSHGVHCQVDINPFDTNRCVLALLAQEGFVTRSYAVTLFGETAALVSEAAVSGEVTVAPATSPAQFDWVASAMPACFEVTEPTWIAWQMDAMRVTFDQPDWRTYIAHVDGEPAGFAQLHITAGVGALTIAGTLEPYRKRGVQSALIHRRIADAAAAGCDLIVGQTSLGSGSQQNMLRAGLRVAYTKATFTDRRPSAHQGAPQ